MSIFRRLCRNVHNAAFGSLPFLNTDVNGPLRTFMQGAANGKKEMIQLTNLAKRSGNRSPSSGPSVSAQAAIVAVCATFLLARSSSGTWKEGWHGGKKWR